MGVSIAAWESTLKRVGVLGGRAGCACRPHYGRHSPGGCAQAQGVRSALHGQCPCAHPEGRWRVHHFDQLALAAPKGAGTVLLRGPKNDRIAVKRRGAAGIPHSSTVPLSRGKGRKFEKARGRRRSLGFKV